MNMLFMNTIMLFIDLVLIFSQVLPFEKINTFASEVRDIVKKTIIM